MSASAGGPDEDLSVRGDALEEQVLVAERQVERLAAMALAADQLARRKLTQPLGSRALGWEERLEALQWAVHAAQQRLRRLAE